MTLKSRYQPPDSGNAKHARERRRDPQSPISDRKPQAEELRIRSLKGSLYSRVDFDAKGNAVLDWRIDLPARRADDETLDYLKALDTNGLELADAAGVAPVKSRVPGYNPYDKAAKK